MKELGLTTMDYTQVQCPEVDAILSTGVRVLVNETMNDEYIVQLAQAIRKVAQHIAST